MVWKPSPLAAATSQIYADAARCSELPAGVFNMAVGDDDTGAELAAHADVDCVVFTGSTANGQRLRKHTIERIDQKQILHLGAKNAAVVNSDAAIELAAYEIATSAFMSAGQRCTSISRAYVQHQVVDAFVRKLLLVCQTFKIGPPGSRAFYGPMLSAERRANFQAALDAAPSQGATPLFREARLDTPGYFVGPSVHLVEDNHSGAPYQDNELFGPDLAIHPVVGVNEALKHLNASKYGLAAALFTNDNRMWQRFSREIQVGTVLLNVGTHSISGRLPFGGVKASGQGGRAGCDATLALRREISVQERRSDVVDIWPGTRSPRDDG